MYINDLQSNIPNNLILYSDDTTAIIKTKSTSELDIKLNQALTDLTKWFDVNGIKLKREKTQQVKFCTVQLKVKLIASIVFQGKTKFHFRKML